MPTRTSAEPLFAPREPMEAESGEMHRKALLICGIASSLYHAGMTAHVTIQAEGYRSMSQAVSELSAVDAPTRPLSVALGIPYTCC